MVKVAYTPTFLKEFKKLEKDLQNEAIEKIELFEEGVQHPFLKTHKLKGKLKDRYSFSVNYKTRIVFQYLSKKDVIFLAIGDHDVYK